MISKIIMSLPVYLRLVFSYFTYIDSLRVDVSLHLRHISTTVAVVITSYPIQ